VSASAKCFFFRPLRAVTCVLHVTRFTAWGLCNDVCYPVLDTSRSYSLVSFPLDNSGVVGFGFTCCDFNPVCGSSVFFRLYRFGCRVFLFQAFRAVPYCTRCRRRCSGWPVPSLWFVMGRYVLDTLDQGPFLSSSFMCSPAWGSLLVGASFIVSASPLYTLGTVRCHMCPCSCVLVSLSSACLQSLRANLIHMVCSITSITGYSLTFVRY